MWNISSMSFHQRNTVNGKQFKEIDTPNVIRPCIYLMMNYYSVMKGNELLSYDILEEPKLQRQSLPSGRRNE
jgi:hypothetical protein